MIQYPVRDLCLWLTSLSTLAQKVGQLSISYGRNKISTLPPNLNAWSLIGEIKTTIQSLEDLLTKCDLEASLDRVKRAQFSLQKDQEISLLHNQMLVLEETITDELTRRMFMFVPNKKAEFYTSLEGMFPETWKAFPDMRDDIAGACKCYAMNQNTACVFHCMGVAQGGLHTLAKDLQVSFPFPVDLAEWKNVIDKIEAEIRKLEQLPKGQIKDEKLKFYSNVAVQFRYFKDAWRNHVAHFREKYDEHQALSILIHVRDFMEHLSVGLSNP